MNLVGQPGRYSALVSKLRNRSARFLLFGKFELLLVLARGEKFEPDDYITSRPEDRAVGSSPHLLANRNENFSGLCDPFIRRVRIIVRDLRPRHSGRRVGRYDCLQLVVSHQRTAPSHWHLGIFYSHGGPIQLPECSADFPAPKFLNVMDRSLKKR